MQDIIEEVLSLIDINNEVLEIGKERQIYLKNLFFLI